MLLRQVGPFQIRFAILLVMFFATQNLTAQELPARIMAAMISNIE